MHVEPGSQSAAHEAIPSPTIGQSRPSKRALLPTPRHTGPHAHAWTPPAGALQTASPRGSASAPRNAHTEEPRACAQWLGVPRTTAPPRSCVGVFTPLCPRPPSPSLARRSFSPFSAPYPPREGLVWLRCLYLLLPPPPPISPRSLATATADPGADCGRPRAPQARAAPRHRGCPPAPNSHTSPPAPSSAMDPPERPREAVPPGAAKAAATLRRRGGGGEEGHAEAGEDGAPMEVFGNGGGGDAAVAAVLLVVAVFGGVFDSWTHYCTC